MFVLAAVDLAGTRRGLLFLSNSSATSLQVGRFAVTAAHPIDTPDYGPLLRFQGVALPPDFLTHYSTFDVLLRRAAQPNPAPLPALKMPAADPRALADV